MGRKEARVTSNVVGVASLSLENYANIYAYVLKLKSGQSPYTVPRGKRLLTAKNLSQVLKIHGFSTVKLNKEALLAGLAHAEMFNPHRSSVDLGNFECDISMEEMERDMAALEWVECPSKSANGLTPYPLLHRVPLSSMSAPNPAFTKIADSGETTRCSRQISAIEGYKQPLPLQSVTATGMRDLLKSVMQKTNSATGNACEKEGVIITQNCSVLCDSKVEGGDTIAGL